MTRAGSPAISSTSASPPTRMKRSASTAKAVASGALLSTVMTLAFLTTRATSVLESAE
jgi:hypothetical protein